MADSGSVFSSNVLGINTAAGLLSSTPICFLPAHFGISVDQHLTFYCLCFA